MPWIILSLKIQEFHINLPQFFNVFTIYCSSQKCNEMFFILRLINTGHTFCNLCTIAISYWSNLCFFLAKMPKYLFPMWKVQMFDEVQCTQICRPNFNHFLRIITANVINKIAFEITDILRNKLKKKITKKMDEFKRKNLENIFFSKRINEKVIWMRRAIVTKCEAEFIWNLAAVQNRIGVSSKMGNGSLKSVSTVRNIMCWIGVYWLVRLYFDIYGVVMSRCVCVCMYKLFVCKINTQCTQCG